MNPMRSTAIAALAVALASGLIAGSATAGKVQGIARVPVAPLIKGLPTPVTKTYRFSVDDIVIQKTRSLHNDTDYVYLNVLGVPGQNAKVKFLGDVNDGTHAVGLYVDVPVAPGQTVTLKYETMNSGYDQYEPGVVEEIIDSVLTNKLNFLFVGNCDGIVGQGTHTFTEAQLAAGSQGGHEFNPGTDSSIGCGSNSKYYTDWSIKALS